MPPKPNISSVSRSPRPRISSARPEAQGLGRSAEDFEVFWSMPSVGRAKQIRAGFDAQIVTRVADELLEIPLQSLLQGLRLPASTIKRKLADGDRLNSSESDRIARVLLVLLTATDVIEDGIAAARWIRTPHIELAGVRPLDELDTQTGYDRVKDLLLRLEHGIGI